MFFLTIDPKDFSKDYAKRIAEHLITRDQKHPMLTDEQRQKLEVILRPSFSNNDHQIKQLCQDIIETLSITTDKGATLKFHRDDEAGLLYFGDEEGWQTAKQLHQNEQLDTGHLNR